MKINIKKASYDDALKANKLLTELIHTEKQYDANINEKYIVSSYYEEAIENDDNCLLVAKDNDEIIGYLYGHIINNGDSCINKVAKLDALYIVENKRGLKIGSSLIDEFKKWSLGKECRFIEVVSFISNISAYSLYKSFGFKDVKVIMSLDMKD